MTRLVLPSPGMVGETAEMLRWFRTYDENGLTGELPYRDWSTDVLIWCRTTTSSEFSTYPTDPSHKFVVEFGDMEFDDTDIATEEREFKPYTYDDADKHKVMAYCNVHLYEGCVVRGYWQNKFLWLLPPPFYVVKIETAIPARVDAVPGEGDVKLEQFNEDTGEYETVQDANSQDATLKVLNPYTSESVTGGGIIYPGENRWHLVEEDCN